MRCGKTRVFPYDGWLWYLDLKVRNLNELISYSSYLNCLKQGWIISSWSSLHRGSFAQTHQVGPGELHQDSPTLMLVIVETIIAYDLKTWPWLLVSIAVIRDALFLEKHVGYVFLDISILQLHLLEKICNGNSEMASSWKQWLPMKHV